MFNFFCSLLHGKLVLSTNTYRIVMKPKYDVNECLEHLPVNFDNFLKNFRRLDEIFMKFHENVIRVSKLCQKVIKIHGGGALNTR